MKLYLPFRFDLNKLWVIDTEFALEELTPPTVTDEALANETETDRSSIPANGEAKALPPADEDAPWLLETAFAPADELAFFPIAKEAELEIEAEKPGKLLAKAEEWVLVDENPWPKTLDKILEFDKLFGRALKPEFVWASVDYKIVAAVLGALANKA